MPTKCTLHYLPVAQNDLIEIFDYIAKGNRTSALSFVDKLDKRIGLLAS